MKGAHGWGVGAPRLFLLRDSGRLRLEEDGGAGRWSTQTRLSVFSAFCSSGEQLEVNMDHGRSLKDGL